MTGAGLFSLLALAAAPEVVAQVGEGAIQIRFDRRGHSQLLAGQTALGGFRPAEIAVVAGRPVGDFPVQSTRPAAVKDAIGTGTGLEVSGQAAGLRRDLSVRSYREYPGLLVVQARYTAVAPGVRFDRWIERRFLPVGPPPPRGAPPLHPALHPKFWSYQGASYANRPDWVLPVRPGSGRRNFLGMNATDYGGGTPVVDLWRPDLGLAVGHLERTPLLVSLPVKMPDRTGVQLGVEGEVGRVLAVGETVETPRLFLMVHRGDHFETLAAYRRIMTAQGTRFPEPHPSAYEPIWCGWGYERNFTPAQITATLPKVVELGFRWAVIDDGWQTAEGDWRLHPRKFPGGDSDMRGLTDQIRRAGLKPMLWWAPLAADPGTQLLKDHPDWLLLDRDGKPRKISWWNSFYLCPAHPPVQAAARELATRMVRDWGFDGLKLDGQHLNAAPPCHNPAHRHTDPRASFEQVPEFFRQIFETVRGLKQESLVELCPCGTGYAFATMPFYDMPAASDPESSWQVRSKGKTLKALMGPRVPYFGDHVELSEGGRDFASTIGVGGVVGSQLTLPGNGPSPRKYQLTAEKEPVWKKWVALYREKMLSRGEYLGGLYDIGFDRPEAHAIRKGGKMYYAFYARRFRGSVQLRGLEPRAYCLRDYVAGKGMGGVQGPQADLSVTFTAHLLLEATPRDAGAACPE
jgi:alpha-galactosidase